MSEYMWYWNNGNNKIYTRNTEVAEKAMKDGMFVMARKIKPNILKF